MTGKECTQAAMRTNDDQSVDRLVDKIMIYHRFNPDIHGWDRVEIKDFGVILNACLGLSGEVGEAVDMVKKWIFYESELDETHLKKEIGDVMWYVACLCHGFGYDLDEIMELNIEKHRKRYPNGFNVYDANHRKDGDL